MQHHQQLSDTEFARQFTTGTLPPQWFSHEAHLRLAYVHIKQLGVDEACLRVCTDIQRFDRLHGDGTKFHRTLTIASVMAVNHFVQKASGTTFVELLTEFPRLRDNFRGLLECHYSRERYLSAEAKNNYIEPDLLPFT